MRKIVFVLAAAGMFGFGSAAVAASGEESPTFTHENPSSCLGAERAGRNSVGGDREKGGFGPAQEAFVQSLEEQGIDYGQWLQGWKATNCEPS